MINWIVRYSKILKKYPQLFDPDVSILEVGCGGNGIAPYLKRKVVGLDKTFPENISEYVDPVIGSVTGMQFADSSFDIVICVDMLEHIYNEHRRKAISEIIRVARKKIIISSPIGNVALAGDQHLHRSLSAIHCPTPDWLTDHLNHGLPSLYEIFCELEHYKFKFKLIPNESMLQHYGGLFLDIFYSLSNPLLSVIHGKKSFDPPIQACEWDLFYSYIFDIEKTHKYSSVNLCSEPAQVEGGLAYAVYHEKFPADHLGGALPIFTGKFATTLGLDALTDVLDGMQPLDNRFWCELTAIYKIWKKGPRSERVGFFHYRRLFNFNSDVDRDTYINYDDLLDYKIIDNALEGKNKELIIPAPLDLGMTIYDQYTRAHAASDICLMYSIVMEKHNQLTPYIKEHFIDHKMYANNMFIAKWEDFNEICTIWFDVLKEVEAKIDFKVRDRYQGRAIGFLAERLFDLWVRYKRAKGSEIRETGVYLVRFKDHNVGDWTPVKF